MLIVPYKCTVYFSHTLFFDYFCFAFGNQNLQQHLKAVYNYPKRLLFMPLNGLDDNRWEKCAFANVWATCQTTRAVFEGDVWMCCSALWDAFGGRGYGYAGRACSRYDSSGHVIDPVGCVMEEETIVRYSFSLSASSSFCCFPVLAYFILVFFSLDLSLSICLQ